MFGKAHQLITKLLVRLLRLFGKKRWVQSFHMNSNKSQATEILGAEIDVHLLLILKRAGQKSYIV